MERWQLPWQPEEYLPALNTLKGNMVAIADMTTMHKYLLKRKRYYDMSETM